MRRRGSVSRHVRSGRASSLHRSLSDAWMYFRISWLNVSHEVWGLMKSQLSDFFLFHSFPHSFIVFYDVRVVSVRSSLYPLVYKRASLQPVSVWWKLSLMAIKEAIVSAKGLRTDDDFDHVNVTPADTTASRFLFPLSEHPPPLLMFFTWTNCVFVDRRLLWRDEKCVNICKKREKKSYFMEVMSVKCLYFLLLKSVCLFTSDKLYFY